MPGSRTAGGAQHQEVVGVGPALPETGGGQLGAAADLGRVRPRELAAVALLGDRLVELGLERGQVLGEACCFLAPRLLVAALAIAALGSAASRARVWQFVWASGVGGRLQKN